MPLLVCSWFDSEMAPGAGFEILQCGDGFQRVWKEEPSVMRVALDLDDTIADAPFDPGVGYLQRLRHFGNGQPS